MGGRRLSRATAEGVSAAGKGGSKQAALFTADIRRAWCPDQGLQMAPHCPPPPERTSRHTAGCQGRPHLPVSSERGVVAPCSHPRWHAQVWPLTARLVAILTLPQVAEGLLHTEGAIVRTAVMCHCRLLGLSLGFVPFVWLEPEPSPCSSGPEWQSLIMAPLMPGVSVGGAGSDSSVKPNIYCMNL